MKIETQKITTIGSGEEQIIIRITRNVLESNDQRAELFKIVSESIIEAYKKEYDVEMKEKLAKEIPNIIDKIGSKIAIAGLKSLLSTKDK